MIFVGKVPYRISLLGGASDLNWFVKEKQYGHCLGYPLKKFSYTIINKLPCDSQKGILDYSVREIYSSIDDIVHPIIREVLKEFHLNSYIELKSIGFANSGSGLGGSSSFLLSLIAALSKAFDINLSHSEIIEKSCTIEINNLSKPIGKQDQFLCANGGINSFKFNSDDSVNRNNLSSIKKETISRLIKDFYLIPTNQNRNSSKVLNSIKNDHSSINKILEIRKIAENFINDKEEREYKIEEKFHASMRESWIVKKTLSNVMSDYLQDQFREINLLIPNNWIRLIGAGLGGYFLVSSKISYEEILKITNQNSIKGIFKAEISEEGLSCVCL